MHVWFVSSETDYFSPWTSSSSTAGKPTHWYIWKDKGLPSQHYRCGNTASMHSEFSNHVKQPAHMRRVAQVLKLAGSIISLFIFNDIQMADYTRNVLMPSSTSVMYRTAFWKDAMYFVRSSSSSSSSSSSCSSPAPQPQCWCELSSVLAELTALYIIMYLRT